LLDPDLSVSSGHLCEREQSLEVDVAHEPRREGFDFNTTRRRMEHGGRGHAASERMQQEFHRVSPLIVAKQNLGLPVRELESFLP
jgi:hypothetical protein